MSRTHIRVLLVEDNPGDAELIQDFLEQVRDLAVELVVAPRLSAALEHLSAGSADVVLLDLGLPDCRGIETLERFVVSQPHVPVVILTGLNEEALGLEAVRKGAQDYLVKGNIGSPLLTRSIRYAMERAARLQTDRELYRAEQQMKIARAIQQNLFPGQAPVLHGFDVAGAAYPAESTGGDYFDYLWFQDGGFGAVVADVAGHGIGPALLVAETYAYLRAFADMTSDVSELLTRTNRLLSHGADSGRFVTLFLAKLNVETRTVLYAGAGHIGFHIDALGRANVLASTGPPLGIVDGSVIPCGPALALKPGDLLLLLTDGFFETISPAGQMFGKQRIMDVVRDSRHQPAAEILATLRDAVRTFAQDQPPQDDMTAVVVKVE